jgi:hypothetical protein
MATNRPGYDTAYAHRKGRRSRPRSVEAMGKLIADAEAATLAGVAARRKHSRKNLPARTGDLQTARARIERAMIGVRQESARLQHDPARRRAWGPQLAKASAACRREKHRLMRMLGEWHS